MWFTSILTYGGTPYNEIHHNRRNNFKQEGTEREAIGLGLDKDRVSGVKWSIDTVRRPAGGVEREFLSL